MPEHELLIWRADAQRLKHLRLQLRLVDSNATAADLHTVENHVVGFGTNLGKLFLVIEQRQVIGFRPRKRMVHRVPLVFLRAELEERKICDPEKIPEFFAGNEFLDLGYA